MSQATNIVIIGAAANQNQSNRSTGRSIADWINKPQFNAMATACFLFISSGMNLARGLGWFVYRPIDYTDYFSSWFMGAILGALLAAALVNFIKKRLLLAFCCLLILIEGILFTSAPYNTDALYSGRAFNGIATGLATVVSLVHAGEITDNAYRGRCLAMEQYAITFGIAIQMIYASQWDVYDFSSNRALGIIDIILALLATACLKMVIESPIFYIRRGQESEALACLASLYNPMGVTTVTNAKLQELNNYVREHENYTLGECLQRSSWPLLKMLIFRSMMLAFCISMPLTVAFEFGYLESLNFWTAIVAAVLRLFGSFIAHCTVDFGGRKMTSMISSVILGAFVIAVAALCQTYLNTSDGYYMSVVTSLSIILQFFAGLYTPCSSAYMGEAFPLKLKSYLIAFCVIVEQIIHIVVLYTLPYTLYGVYVALLSEGILIVVAFLLMPALLPETKRTSLKEAQDRFSNMYYIKMY